ncbi:MAG: hypothetical protein MJE77_22285 [Proteobacteria bacterium]|nr:hypothetical protein [Pseudomonadota bacterium]
MLEVLGNRQASEVNFLGQHGQLLDPGHLVHGAPYVFLPDAQGQRIWVRLGQPERAHHLGKIRVRRGPHQEAQAHATRRIGRPAAQPGPIAPA